MINIDDENMEASGFAHYGVRKHLGRVVYKSAGDVVSGDDLRAWMKRCGLRQSDAAEILGVTRTHLQKLLRGPKISATLSKLAAAHEASITPIPDHTNIVDSNAALGEYHEVTALGDQCVLTGGIAANLKGMTTMVGHLVDVAMPPHPAAVAAGRSEDWKWQKPVRFLACPLYPERIESRIDTDGNRYRIADAVRIVVDSFRLNVEPFSMEEILREALDEHDATKEEIVDFAKRGDAHLAPSERVLPMIEAEFDRLGL
jgi:hypothetical protein